MKYLYKKLTSEGQKNLFQPYNHLLSSWLSDFKYFSHFFMGGHMLTFQRHTDRIFTPMVFTSK